MNLHAPENMTKQELLAFYQDLEKEISSLEIGQTVDLCAPNDFWGDVVSVYCDIDCYFVNDYIIVPINMVINNVFQVLAY